MEEFFQLYSNLLSEDARYHWEKIVEEQIDKVPYKNLQGVEVKEKQVKSWDSFETCVTFHLLTVFPNDAAEQQSYYITNTLKKPQRVPIRQFSQRVAQLNGYLSQLPGRKDSPQATDSTEKVQSLSESNLAVLVLKMCPESWQDQWDLTQNIVPQSMRELINVLENIEKVMASQAREKPAALKSNKETNGGTEKGGAKRPGLDANGRIPKKAKTTKFCQLCKTHGGAHTTHNTSDCRRYNKDGTKKPNFKNSSGNESHKNSAFAQLTAKIEKLEKSLKKRTKSSKKRKYKSDSDSDSE